MTFVHENAEFGDLFEIVSRKHRVDVGLSAAEDSAFTLTDANRRAEMEKAHDAITPIFWGERIQLRECCDIIREFLKVMA